MSSIHSDIIQTLLKFENLRQNMIDGRFGDLKKPSYLSLELNYLDLIENVTFHPTLPYQDHMKCKHYSAFQLIRYRNEKKKKQTKKIKSSLL